MAATVVSNSRGIRATRYMPGTYLVPGAVRCVDVHAVHDRSFGRCHGCLLMLINAY